MSLEHYGVIFYDIKKQIYLTDISAQIHACTYTYVSIPYVGIIQIRFAGLGIHPTLSLLDTQAPCCSLFYSFFIIHNIQILASFL